MSWTDDRVELLKKLWAEGLSASQVAARLGGITRNAVIGKVHRLGLSGRGKAKAATSPRPRKPTRAPSAPAPIAQPVRGNTVLTPAFLVAPAVEAQPEIDLHDDVVIPLSERVTIMELRESMCRWPMGDPTKPDFRFCGGRAIAGLPYCPHHARIAYQPVAERKRIRA